MESSDRGSPEILARSNTPALDKILGKPFPVLDQGFVRLIDYMGDEASIVQAARVSYGKGTKKVSEDRGLLRYLMRHWHTTPFEMCELKVHVRVPMDCWRQWIRHRTASTNEYSTRYSEAIDAAQQTARGEWRQQATTNRQGSGDFFPTKHETTDETNGFALSVAEDHFLKLARRLYESRIEAGVAREQARKDLPLSTYCYDESTEVLTDNGFVRWPDVTKDMRLGIWDAAQGSLCYERPEYLTVDPYDGDMYRVNHRGVDLLVTPHHKMWVKCKGTNGWDADYSLVAAEDLGHRSLVRYSKLAPLHGPTWKAPAELSCKDDKSLLRLMGFFIGDGTAQRSGDKNALVFSLKRSRKIKFLGEVCERLGWECSLRTGNQFVVRKNGITDLFRDLFYEAETGHKRIPDFMLSLNVGDAAHVINGLCASDGSRYGKKNSWRFDTTALRVAERVMILGIHAGQAVNGPWITEKANTKHNDVHHVQFFDRGKEPVVNQMNRNTSWEHYSGKVYCAKTRTGVLVVRRNGRVALSGNTEAYWKIDLKNLLGFLALRMDSHAQKEIRDYATVIGEQMVALWLPNVWEAFNDYHPLRGAMTFTRPELDVIKAINSSVSIHPILVAEKFGWMKVNKAGTGLRRNRERSECEVKLEEIGLYIPWEGIESVKKVLAKRV